MIKSTWFMKSSPDVIKRDREYDVFKDTLIRYFGYANEVGEAFRALIHVNWVRLSYVVASGYVVADSAHKGFVTYKKQTPDNEDKKVAVFVSVMDTLVWQGFASVAIPGFTINRLCAVTAYVLKKSTPFPSPVRKWTTTGIGLACIPFIIKPIDRSVDHIMDEVVRQYYPTQKRKKNNFHNPPES